MLKKAFPFTLAVMLGLSASGLAQAADQELAHSQKWGIRVTAVDDGTGWCGGAVKLRITADDPAIFQTADFTKIIGAVGNRILAAECPAAKAMTLSGVTADQTVVYTGAAAADGQWTPRAVADAAPQAATSTAPAQTQAQAQGEAQTIAPQQAQNPDTPPPAAPVPETPAHPAIGDWKASGTCKTWNSQNTYDMILSIDEVEDKKVAGLAEIRPANDNSQPLAVVRYSFAGFLDMPTRQINMDWEDRLYSGIRMNLPNLAGTLESDKNIITMREDYCNTGQLVFHRTSPTPETASRIKARIAAGKALVEKDRARIPTNRIVGKVPGGEPQVPSCDEFLAWFNAAPVGQPIRLFANDAAIDAHFKDDISARYFGTPAYYWLGEVDMERSYVQACRKVHNRDTRRAIAGLLDDYYSQRAMKDRRSLDRVIQTAVSSHATTGAGPAEMYARAAQLDTPEEFEDVNGHRVGLPGDRAAGAAIAAEHRDAFALATVENAIARMAALPASAESGQQIQAIVDDTLTLFGEAKPPQAETRLKKAAEDRKLAMAGPAADAVITEIQGLDKTVDGLTRAQSMATRFEATFGTSPAVLKVNGAAQAFRKEAATNVLATETAAVKALDPQTPVSTVVNTRNAVVSTLQDIDSEGVAAYKTVVTAKLAELATAMVPKLDAEVDAHGGDAVEKLSVVEAIRGQASQDMEPEAAAPIDAWATEKSQALTEAYVEEVTQNILSSGYAFEDILRIVPAAERVAARLEGDAYADARARIVAAAGTAVEQALEDGQDAFRVELKGRKQDNRTVDTTADQARRLYSQARTVPGWEPYAEMALEWARDTADSLCDSNLDESGMDDDIPVLVGETIVTTRDIACALEQDSRITDWTSPGLFGDDLYTMRIYNERQGFIVITLAEQEVRPDVYALVGKTLKEERDERPQSLSREEWQVLSLMLFARAARKGEIVAEHCPEDDLPDDAVLADLPRQTLLYCDLP